MRDSVCPKVYATQCLWLRALGLIVHFILMLVWNSNSEDQLPLYRTLFVPRKRVLHMMLRTAV